MLNGNIRVMRFRGPILFSRFFETCLGREATPNPRLYPGTLFRFGHPLLLSTGLGLSAGPAGLDLAADALESSGGAAGAQSLVCRRRHHDTD